MKLAWKPEYSIFQRFFLMTLGVFLRISELLAKSKFGAVIAFAVLILLFFKKNPFVFFAPLLKILIWPLLLYRYLRFLYADRRPLRPYTVRLGDYELPTESRLRHTHIVGATGSGKTVLIEHLLFQDLKNGLGAVVIDPKGDRELFERVRDFCRSIGRSGDLHYLSATYPKESKTWNPCQLGSASNLQTKFYNANTFSEPHYAKACEKGLLRAFENLLRQSPNGFALPDLVREIEIQNRETKNPMLEGLGYDLYNLASGEWSTVIGAKSLERREKAISLLEITRRNEILFVDLPTEASAVQSARVGKLLLQELMLISGLRKTFPNLRSDRPFSIYIDEFDAFASESFVTLLNKGRSSGFMIHLAHQTLSDLERISPTFAGQVMGNTNIRSVFRQDDPKDAETWSKFFGTERTVKTTWQTDGGAETGMRSNREVQEFRVKPDEIKELRTGRCILSSKTDGILTLLDVPPPLAIEEPTLELERFDPSTLSNAASVPASRKIPLAPKFKFSPEIVRSDVPGKKKGNAP
ncbi:MAG: type IV secretion system DNA-binding domain-containing protein [Bdellovibrionales bacterium]|nr:type IV secretion system DNA-binding domain-containing protein [Bdellovibrionales bacterium]